MLQLAVLCPLHAVLHQQASLLWRATTDIKPTADTNGNPHAVRAIPAKYTCSLVCRASADVPWPCWSWLPPQAMCSVYLSSQHTPTCVQRTCNALQLALRLSTHALHSLPNCVQGKRKQPLASLQLVDGSRARTGDSVYVCMSDKLDVGMLADVERCVLCSQEGAEDASMLECDACLRGFHLGCLDPPLEEVPEVGHWNGAALWNLREPGFTWAARTRH